MDCKNFDALDDMCKACLSGGTSTNPKEQKYDEAPVKMANGLDEYAEEGINSINI